MKKKRTRLVDDPPNKNCSLAVLIILSKARYGLTAKMINEQLLERGFVLPIETMRSILHNIKNLRHIYQDGDHVCKHCFSESICWRITEYGRQRLYDKIGRVSAIEIAQMYGEVLDLNKKEKRNDKAKSDADRG